MACLKTSSFLKLVYKINEDRFVDFVTTLSIDDLNFTIQSCIEITRIIDNVHYCGDDELIKLVKIVLKLVAIEDENQLIKFECLIGVPSLIVSEQEMRCRFPLFGFHKLADEFSKWIEYKTVVNSKDHCSLLKKIMALKTKDKLMIEVFLTMLEACITNHALLKYLRKMPSEEPVYQE